MLDRLRRHRTARPLRFARALGCGLEVLESRQLLAAVPFGAQPNDTAEYMLGDVNVTVVFLESSEGTQNTETWTPEQIADSKAKIVAGLEWWEDTLMQGNVSPSTPGYHPQAYLKFHPDFTYADTPFEVGFEPINRTSDLHTDFVNSFLASEGYPGADIDARIYAYNNAQRIAKQANWSFTIFVVHDANDFDKRFAAGGQFDRSFAYPGGRYLVTLSDRPPEIIAHETGHMFYAFDEYVSGGALYSATRGYYAQQNLNGANGAPSGFAQQNSLMSSGSLLTASYLYHTLPESTRALVGWRDSDSDGIIDVLDVTHALTGTGYADTSGNYRFVGESHVRTLANKNPSGLGNDITINRLTIAEYSFDGTNWLTAQPLDAYAADLDLTIPLAGNTQIAIRTRDARTGVISDVFSATTAHQVSTDVVGISGFAFNDRNHNGVWNAGEGVLSGRTVQLVDASGIPLAGPLSFDPDAYIQTGSINTVIPEARFSTIQAEAGSTSVWSRQHNYGSSTSYVFANRNSAGNDTTLWSSDRKLKITLQTAARQISLNARGDSDGGYGRLEIYDVAGNMLGRYTTGRLTLGVVETMTVGSDQADIAYAIAYGHANTTITLDQLVIGAPVATTTDAYGAYAFGHLVPGTYYVQMSVPAEWEATTPANGRQTVVLANGDTATADFGQRSTNLSWHNAVKACDVNGDNQVTPLDALLIINELNYYGPRELTNPPSGEDPPRMIDVDGDGVVTPLDALLVINYLNSGSEGEGEVEGEPASAAVASAPATTPAPLAAAGEGSVSDAAASVNAVFAASGASTTWAAPLPWFWDRLAMHAPSAWQPSDDDDDLLTLLAEERP